MGLKKCNQNRFVYDGPSDPISNPIYATGAGNPQPFQWTAPRIALAGAVVFIFAKFFDAI